MLECFSGNMIALPLLTVAAVSSEAVWEAVPQNVITDRSPVQVFPNGTFDESVLPMLTDQARQVLPYVMHKAGIADDKLPTFWMAAGAEPRFALEQAVVRIAELDFPEGLETAGVAGMEWWCQVSESGEVLERCTLTRTRRRIAQAEDDHGNALYYNLSHRRGHLLLSSMLGIGRAPCSRTKRLRRRGGSSLQSATSTFPFRVT